MPAVFFKSIICLAVPVKLISNCHAGQPPVVITIMYHEHVLLLLMLYSAKYRVKRAYKAGIDNSLISTDGQPQ